MTMTFLSLLLANLAGNIPMTEAQPTQALQLEVSEPAAGTVAVSLIANSQTAQRVSYELNTIGASSTRHKGATQLRANQLATLSTVSFSAGPDWCVSLTVEEENGERYTLEKGPGCAVNKPVRAG